MTYKCPHCKKECIESGMIACPECFKNIKPCPNCGQYAKPQAPICVYCGLDFEASQAAVHTHQESSSSQHFEGPFRAAEGSHVEMGNTKNEAGRDIISGTVIQYGVNGGKGGECPICGGYNDTGYFRCKGCEREYICKTHQDKESYLCVECEKERQRRCTPGYLTDGPLPGMKFAYIPAGSFMMGSPDSDGDAYSDEKPQHKVTLDAFRMMTTPVTQAMWERVMGENPSRFKGDSSRPVEKVSWDDIQEFLKKLNSMDRGKGYRLPTEAEWEYACRAGTTTKYWSGDSESDLARVGWYKDNSEGTTHPVGRKPANPWGLYDMHGNVYEWCEDWFDNYQGSPVKNPQGPDTGSYRVIRGGSWSLIARACRSAYRNYGHNPSNRGDSIGFRLVRSE